MNPSLLIAAVLTTAIALAHTLLGERYVLRPFLAGPVPKLFGSERFMRRTLRYAWHLTSLLGLGFAALLAFFARGPMQHVTAIEIVSATFLLSALMSIIMTRGKHFSWIVFLAIGLLTWFF
jgi:drug/metabolite transporter (DMT)-like permease